MLELYRRRHTVLDVSCRVRLSDVKTFSSWSTSALLAFWLCNQIMVVGGLCYKRHWLLLYRLVK